MKYQCISADSHLEIRPDRYCQRVPEKYRDRAPKVITLEDGTLAVLQEGQPLERQYVIALMVKFVKAKQPVPICASAIT